MFISFESFLKSYRTRSADRARTVRYMIEADRFPKNSRASAVFEWLGRLPVEHQRRARDLYEVWRERERWHQRMGEVSRR